MAKKPKQKISPQEDVKYVQKLVMSGKFEEALAGLDACDIVKSIDRVPAQVLRLLGELYLKDNPETFISTLPKEQRRTLRILLAKSGKYAADRFVKGMMTELKSEKQLRDRLGISGVDVGQAQREARQFNTITSLGYAPHLMLGSNRVYIDFTFLRGEDILFQCKLELDEALSMARGFLGAVKSTIESLEARDGGGSLNLQTDQCQAALKQIRGLLPGVEKSLKRVGSTAAKKKGRPKRKPKRKRSI